MNEILELYEEACDEVKSFINGNPKLAAIIGLCLSFLLIVIGCGGSILKIALLIGGVFMGRWACNILWPNLFNEANAK